MLAFAKGHGTLNDFVCFTDADGSIDPGDDQLRLLCDRRAGIGGDGTLRAVRCAHVPGFEQHRDTWFMDYRNADASIAEMCGNGLRVFLRYLDEEGLIERDDAVVVTRAGVRTGEFLPDGDIRVSMGTPMVGGTVPVGVDGRQYEATVVDVGNPHAVVLLPEAQLAGIDLTRSPSYPAEIYPDGANVEFVERVGPGHIRMRVWERGVGETLSCGTGTVAAAAATAAAEAEPLGTWLVEPPGGRLTVGLTGADATLAGPAVIVARGMVSL